MTNSLINRGAVMAALLLATTSVQAASFEGSTDGVFTNPEGPPGMVVDGIGTSFFEWGVAIPPSGRSSLLFTGNADFGADLGQTFNVGTLTYANGTTQVGTGATGVDLEVTFDFTVPSIPNEVFTYTIHLVNTINTGDVEGDSDVIRIPEGLTLPLSIGGQTCNLTVWFGAVVGNGHVEGDEFHAHEGGSATVDLNGVIICPDGGLTIALLGAALGSIGLVSRKIQK